MSAVPACQPTSTSLFVPSRTTERQGGPSRTRHLHSVPTGPDVRDPGASWRLTRRGRLSVSIVVAAVAALSLALTFGGGGASLRVEHTVSVRPGQTLSEVASRELPGIDASQAVARLQLVNRLSSAEVHAGQVLEIPSLP